MRCRKKCGIEIMTLDFVDSYLSSSVHFCNLLNYYSNCNKTGATSVSHRRGETTPARHWSIMERVKLSSHVHRTYLHSVCLYSSFNVLFQATGKFYNLFLFKSYSFLHSKYMFYVLFTFFFLLKDFLKVYLK